MGQGQVITPEGIRVTWNLNYHAHPERARDLKRALEAHAAKRKPAK